MTALARSRREIEAAQLLAEGGFGTQAISRAYYAAFYGAEQALASQSILGYASEAKTERTIDRVPAISSVEPF